MRAFPLLLEELVLKFELGNTDSSQPSDCMNSSCKVHFMLSVLSLCFIFIEEIEPCQFDIPKF